MSKVDTYPDWMGVKQGKIIFTEADWPATIGFKWGTLVSGTGAAVTRDANHGNGGTGAVSLLTGDLSDDVAEIKRTLPYYVGDGKIALELKFGQESPAFGTTTFSIGIEPRIVAVGFLQGRIQYDVTNDEWQYESDTDIYTAFDPPLVIERPSLNAAAALAGDQFGWCRLVIDVKKREYVSFEAAGKGIVEFRDMTGIPLVNRGAITEDILLLFALAITGGNAAEEFFVTDMAATALN